MDNISRQRSRVALAGRVASALFVAGLFLVLCPIVMAVLTRRQSYEDRESLCALFVAMTGVAIILQAGALEVYRTSLGGLIALALKRQYAKTFDGPFFLILRSFRRYAAYAERLTDYRRMQGERVLLRMGALPSGNTLLDSIQPALRNKGLLVAVGEESAGDILYVNSGDERWRADVELLAAHARAIIMLPELSGGVLEEMQLVGGGSLWEKTVVVMPRLRREDYSFRTPAESYRVTGRSFREWGELRRSLSVHGYKLPPPSEAGLVFTINADFSVRHGVPLSEGREDEGLAEALDALTPHLPGGWRPLREVFPLVERSVPRVTFDTPRVLSDEWPVLLIIWILSGVFLLTALFSGLACWQG